MLPDGSDGAGMAESRRPRAGRVISPRFVGRAGELAALRAAARDAIGGRSSTALVEGGAGSGKSRLVAEVARVAAEDGAVVVVGSCVDLGGSPLPYAAVADVLRGLHRQFGSDVLADRVGPWARDLSALLPVLGPPSSVAVDTPASGQARLLNATRHLLESCSELAALVVVVEDLHWADAATRDVVSYLARTLRDVAVLTIVTVRTEPLPWDRTIWEMVGELRQSPGVLHLALPGLTDADVRDQVEAILGRPADGPMLGRIVERADGNPLFVEELVASGGVEDGLSPVLRDVLRRRIERLSPACRSLVAAAAVIGRRSDERLLGAIVGLDEDRFGAALREALDAGVLVKDPGGASYTTRHALLQEAVYDELLPHERRMLHGRAAAVLAPSPAIRGSARARRLGEAAHHLRRSGDDDAALLAFVDAGTSAEGVFAHADASSHYERALELWNAGATAPPDVSLVDLLERAAEARWIGLGDAAGATDLLREALTALEAGDGIRRAELISRLASFTYETHAAAGDALALHAEACQLVGDADGPVRARVLCRHARALMIASHNDQAEAVAREALGVARRSSALVDEADARITLFSCHVNRGEVEEARQGIEATRPIVRAIDDPDTVARFFNNAATFAFHAGRYEEAVRTADEGDARLQLLGLSADDRMNVRSIAASALAVLGRLDEAAQRLAVVEPDLPIAAFNVAVERAHVAWMRGDLAHAREQLDRAASLGSATKDPALDLWLAVVRTAVGIDEGALAVAWRDAQDGLSILAPDIPDAAWMLAVSLRVIADIAVADHLPPSLSDRGALHETADGLLGQLEAITRKTAGSLPVVDAYADQGHAEHSRMSGSAGDPAAWGRAEASWEALGRPYDAAYAKLRRAEAMLARSAAVPGQVEAVLEAARGHAERIGASRLVAECAPLEARLPSRSPSPTRRRADRATEVVAGPASPTVTLQRAGDYWTVTHPGGVAHLRDAKGLRYLAQLLANPDVDIHAAELVSEVGPTRVVARPEGLGLDAGGALGPALDARAKAEYRRRIDELREEIEESRSFNDPSRTERAEEEYDALVAELSRAVGLGGRDRPVGSRAERARVSATKAIRSAIRRIEQQDAELGATLAAAVHTGTFCAYRPLPGVPRWRFVT